MVEVDLEAAGEDGDLEAEAEVVVEETEEEVEVDVLVAEIVGIVEEVRVELVLVIQDPEIGPVPFAPIQTLLGETSATSVRDQRMSV